MSATCQLVAYLCDVNLEFFDILKLLDRTSSSDTGSSSLLSALSKRILKHVCNLSIGDILP